MKQVIQNYKTGELIVDEVSIPLLKDNGVVIKTKSSLISAGTERTKIETAQMNLVEKAISRLDLVKVLLNNIKQEGVVFTFKKAFNKLNTPISLGYSCSGDIVETSSNFCIGDRVVCIGEGTAAHAEYNSSSVKFVTRIPDDVNYEDAAYAGLGAIALNSVEISQLRPNEKVVVIGLGLLGQIVAQLVRAKGCEVLGIEIDENKIALAKSLGMKNGVNPLKDDVYSAVELFTNKKGADAVIIPAASKNNLPIDMAGHIARNKGRVILVGAMPINIPRDEYYKKELLFMISRGFGADIYYNIDENREYSFNYKPISMQENVSNFLQFLSEKKVQVAPLTTHKFNLSDAAKAYEMIRLNREKYLGILFSYDGHVDTKTIVDFNIKKFDKNILNIGFIGAGSFSQGYILPALKKNKNVNLKMVSTATGINANSVAKKFGFSSSTTDYKKVLDDESINCIFIMTRHNLHGKMVVEALAKNKMVYVEKPLCVTREELAEIKNIYTDDKILMVGFNRRFSPFVLEMKKFFVNRVGPLMINYRINAGYLPPEHWVHDNEGGGRIVGEMCHFVDLINYLVGKKIADVSVVCTDDKPTEFSENVAITLKYEDGSIGTIQYHSVGDMGFSRERIEVFGDNSVGVIDNFKEVILSRAGNTKHIKKIGRDMGHNNEIAMFVDGIITNKKAIIPFEDIVQATDVTFRILDQLLKK